MNEPPLVSVIIIFLNAEEFIQEAIDSVFAQSYENWELLLVDDGSTDRSTEIALDYARQYPFKACYLEHSGHRNRGMSASRNLGIARAQGRYVAFLDADDTWLPRKLEEQVAILEGYPEVSMVYGIDQYWYSWTGKPEHCRLDFVPELRIQSNRLFAPPELLPQFLRGKTAIPCPTNILVRRSTFEQVGTFVEDFKGSYEDQAFYVKVLLQAPVFVSDKCWTRYRQHEKASTAIVRAAGQQQVLRRFYLNWVASYLTQKGSLHEGVWGALRKEEWLVSHYHKPLRSTSARHVDVAVRLTKKWLLRLEEYVLPETLSVRLWTR